MCLRTAPIRWIHVSLGMLVCAALLFLGGSMKLHELLELSTNKKLFLIVGITLLSIVTSLASLILAYAEMVPGADKPNGSGGFKRLGYGKFPDNLSLSIEIIADVVQDAAVPYPTSDVNKLKAELLGQSVRPKLVVVSSEPLPPGWILRLAMLCSAVQTLCVQLLPETRDDQQLLEVNGISKMVMRHRKDASSIASKLSDLDFPNASSLMIIFAPSGRLVWVGDSSDRGMMNEVEMILKTISLSSLPVADQSSRLSEVSISAVTLNAEPSPSLTDLSSQTLYSLETGSLVSAQDAWRLKNPMPRVLSFWATWCQPCVEELPDLQYLSREYAGRVMFLGLVFQTNSAEERSKALGILNEKEVTAGHQYILEDQDMARRLQGINDESMSPVYPYFAVFDRHGNLIERLVGTLEADGNREKLLVALQRAIEER